MDGWDCRSWFGTGLVETDCPHWLPHLTVDEAGMDAKFVVDNRTGDIYFSRRMS